MIRKWTAPLLFLAALGVVGTADAQKYVFETHDLEVLGNDTYRHTIAPIPRVSTPFGGWTNYLSSNDVDSFSFRSSTIDFTFNKTDGSFSIMNGEGEDVIGRLHPQLRLVGADTILFTGNYDVKIRERTDTTMRIIASTTFFGNIEFDIIFDIDYSGEIEWTYEVTNRFPNSNDYHLGIAEVCTDCTVEENPISYAPGSSNSARDFDEKTGVSNEGFRYTLDELEDGVINLAGGGTYDHKNDVHGALSGLNIDDGSFVVEFFNAEPVRSGEKMVIDPVLTASGTLVTCAALHPPNIATICDADVYSDTGNNLLQIFSVGNNFYNIPDNATIINAFFNIEAQEVYSNNDYVLFRSLVPNYTNWSTAPDSTDADVRDFVRDQIYGTGGTYTPYTMPFSVTFGSQFDDTIPATDAAIQDMNLALTADSDDPDYIVENRLFYIVAPALTPTFPSATDWYANTDPFYAEFYQWTLTVDYSLVDSHFSISDFTDTNPHLGVISLTDNTSQWREQWDANRDGTMWVGRVANEEYAGAMAFNLTSFNEIIEEANGGYHSLSSDRISIDSLVIELELESILGDFSNAGNLEFARMPIDIPEMGLAAEGQNHATYNNFGDRILRPFSYGSFPFNNTINTAYLYELNERGRDDFKRLVYSTDDSGTWKRDMFDVILRRDQEVDSNFAARFAIEPVNPSVGSRAKLHINFTLLQPDGNFSNFRVVSTSYNDPVQPHINLDWDFEGTTPDYFTVWRDGEETSTGTDTFLNNFERSWQSEGIQLYAYYNGSDGTDALVIESDALTLPALVPYTDRSLNVTNIGPYSAEFTSSFTKHNTNYVMSSTFYLEDSDGASTIYTLNPATVTGLNPNSQYTVYLQIGGPGDFEELHDLGNPLSQTFTTGPVEAVTGITFTDVTSNAATVNWVYPTFDTLTGFTVSLTNANGDPVAGHSASSTDRSTRFTNLQPNHEHTVSITAHTSAGDSPAATAQLLTQVHMTDITDISVSDVPQVDGSLRMNVSWTYDGDAPQTFEIRRNGVSYHNASGTDTFALIGASWDRDYTIMVRAIVDGESISNSTESHSTAPRRLPGVLQAEFYNPAEYDYRLNVTSTYDPEIAYDPLVFVYEWRMFKDGVSYDIEGTSTGIMDTLEPSYTIDELPPNVQLRVSITTNWGNGDQVTTSYTRSPSPPQAILAPVNVTVSSITDTTVRVDFDYPDDAWPDYPSYITGYTYRITQIDEHGSSFPYLIHFDGTEKGHILRDLEPDFSHYVEVRANTLFGSSDWSSHVAFVTPDTGQIFDVTVTDIPGESLDTVNGNLVSLAWSYNGSRIAERYNIQVDGSHDFEYNTTNTSFIIHTSWGYADINITAYDDNEDRITSTIIAHTSPRPIPSAPTITTTYNSADFTWTYPNYNFVTFRVLYHEGVSFNRDTALVTSYTTNREFVITGLEPNTNYVAAIGALWSDGTEYVGLINTFTTSELPSPVNSTTRVSVPALVQPANSNFSNYQAIYDAVGAASSIMNVTHEFDYPDVDFSWSVSATVKDTGDVARSGEILVSCDDDNHCSHTFQYTVDDEGFHILPSTEYYVEYTVRDNDDSATATFRSPLFTTPELYPHMSGNPSTFGITDITADTATIVARATTRGSYFTITGYLSSATPFSDLDIWRVIRYTDDTGTTVAENLPIEPDFVSRPGHGELDYTFTGLQPNTRYRVDVAPENTRGASSYVSTYFTTGTGPPVLENVTAYHIKRNNVDEFWIEWDVPDGGTDITSINAYYFESLETIGPMYTINYQGIDHSFINAPDDFVNPTDTRYYVALVANDMNGDQSAMSPSGPVTYPDGPDITDDAAWSPQPDGSIDVTVDYAWDRSFFSSTDVFNDYDINLLIRNGSETVSEVNITSNTQTSHTFENLEWGTPYIAEIKGVNDNAETTGEARIAQSPARNVPTSISFNPGALHMDVSWQYENETAYTNAFIRVNTTTPSPNPTLVSSQVINDITSTSIRVGGLSENTLYDFTVELCVEVGCFHSGSVSRSTVDIMDFTIFSVTPNTYDVVLVWELPSGITSTQNTVRAESTNHDTGYLTISPSVSTYTFIRLYPDTDYEITLQTRTEGGSNIDVSMNVTTGSPEPFTFTTTTNYESFEIDWDSLAIGNVVYRGYLDGVSYQNGTDIGSMTFTGLEPGTSYNFTVNRHHPEAPLDYYQSISLIRSTLSLPRLTDPLARPDLDNNLYEFIINIRDMPFNIGTGMIRSSITATVSNSDHTVPVEVDRIGFAPPNLFAAAFKTIAGQQQPHANTDYNFTVTLDLPNIPVVTETFTVTTQPAAPGQPTNVDFTPGDGEITISWDINTSPLFGRPDTVIIVYNHGGFPLHLGQTPPQLGTITSGIQTVQTSNVDTPYTINTSDGTYVRFYLQLSNTYGTITTPEFIGYTLPNKPAPAQFDRVPFVDLNTGRGEVTIDYSIPTYNTTIYTAPESLKIIYRHTPVANGPRGDSDVTTISGPITDSQYVHEITDKRQDTYEYQLVTQAGAGDDLVTTPTTTSDLFYCGIPERPTLNSIEAISTQHVRANTITTPSDQQCEAIGYKLLIFDADVEIPSGTNRFLAESELLLLTDIPHTFEIPNPQTAHPYNFAIQTRNSYGDSIRSTSVDNVYTFTTPPILDLNTSNQSSTTIGVQILAPTTYRSGTNNVVIDEYQLEYRDYRSTQDWNVVASDNLDFNTDPAGITYIFIGESGRAYEFRVAALRSGDIYSAYSPLEYSSPYHLPGEVGFIRAIDRTPQSITLSWTAPEPFAPEIQCYRIFWTSPYGYPNTIHTSCTTDSSGEDSNLSVARISGLDQEAEYSFRIVARTLHGYGQGGYILNASIYSPFNPGDLELPIPGEPTTDPNNPNGTIINPRVTPTSATTTHILLKQVRDPVDQSITLTVQHVPEVQQVECEFDFELSSAEQRSAPFKGVFNNATQLHEQDFTFNFVNYSTPMDILSSPAQEVVHVMCYDTRHPQIESRTVLTNDVIPFVLLVQQFRSGLFGTEGNFGAFDFVTLMVIMISMVGFNRHSPAVGITVAIMILGVAAFMEIISFITPILGIIVLVVTTAILRTRNPG